MPDPTIGILGGMGPEATLNCFAKLIQNTPAAVDQDHLRVVIASNPRIPDRTRAILDGGPSPLPAMVQEGVYLQKAGADFIIIPCVTAHYYINELNAQIELPIISILDAVVDAIVLNHSNIKQVGLIGTCGTLKSGIFQKRLDASGISTVTSDATFQERVMTAIYDIKSDSESQQRNDITVDLVDVADHLTKKGAEGIVAGCTEIPLALSQEDLEVPYFDSLLILARAAIRRVQRMIKDI